MQRSMTITEEPLRWPWSALDLAPSPEETHAQRDDLLRLVQRVPVWIVALWLVGVITFISLGFAADSRLYQRQLSTQASWIAQAGQQEAQCLQNATTDDARNACAATLARQAAAQQVQFDRTRVPWGNRPAAAQMHSAFNALYAAACYDPDAQSADAQCLASTAPTLRTWAEQQATTAANW